MLDTIFSEVSLAPFDTDELQRALSIVDYLNGEFRSYIVSCRFVNLSQGIVNKDSTADDQYIWAYGADSAS
jgi:hypothetical protein